MAKKKAKAKGKGKEGKATVRPDSPRRLLNGMVEKLDICRMSLDTAVEDVDEGKLDGALYSIGEAQCAYEEIGAGAFDEVARQLQVAENEIAEVILRVNM